MVCERQSKKEFKNLVCFVALSRRRKKNPSRTHMQITDVTTHAHTHTPSLTLPAADTTNTHIFCGISECVCVRGSETTESLKGVCVSYEQLVKVTPVERCCQTHTDTSSHCLSCSHKNNTGSGFFSLFFFYIQSQRTNRTMRLCKRIDG